MNIETVNKYLYIPKNPYYFRLLGVVGVISTLFVSIGLFNYFNLSIWYWIFFGPIAAIFILCRIIRFGNQIFYPKFDITKHELFIKDFWNKNNEPSVDIFLPWAGEDTAVYRKVLDGVKSIDYKNIKVYLLDDKGDKQLKSLAKEYKFKYLSRPNKGEFKKSGNLQFGYDNSNGEFVFVLDADFIPSADSLKNTIPYIVSNSKVGILQTPQYFDQSDDIHKRSAIEFGGANVVEEFYKIDMPSRDKFKAALCVGTSAIYRRQAILSVGGTPKVWGTEDVRQGLLITQTGYYVKYLPLIVSIGNSPDTLQGYFRQHNRWCTGSIATIFGDFYTKAKLNPVARVIYATNAGYYITEATSIIFSFHLLSLLYFHGDTLSLNNIIYFLPYLVFNHFLMPLTRVHKYRFGTRLAAYSNIFTYFYTIPQIPFKKILSWEPAGIKQVKVGNEYSQKINIGMLFAIAFIAGLIFTIISKPQILGNYNAYPTLGWSIFIASWYIIFMRTSTNDIRIRMIENSAKESLKVAERFLLNSKVHFMPLLGVILITCFTIQGYSALKDEKAPTFNAVAKIFRVPEIKISTATAIDNHTYKQNKSYKYISKKGDSYSQLALKAIGHYQDDNALNLDPAEKVFVQTNLIKDMKKEKLEINRTITFKATEISKLVKNAKLLNKTQKESWHKYL